MSDKTSNYYSSDIDELSADAYKHGMFNRWVTIVLIATTGLVMSIGGAFFVRQWDEDNLRVDFERRTGNFMSFLQSDVVQKYTRENQEILTELVATLARDGLSEDVLDPFESRMTDSDWITANIVIVPRVSDNNVAAFEADMSELFGNKFQVSRESDAGILRRSGASPVYYPVIATAGPAYSGATLGLDVACSTVAVTALETGLSRKYPVALGRSDDSNALKFTHLVPLPEGVKDPTDPEKTIEGFVGVITNVTLAGLTDFFPLSIGGLDTYMISTPRYARFARGTDPDSLSPSALIHASAKTSSGIVGGASIDMGGMHWDLVSSPRPELLAIHRSNKSLFVALFILAVTVLVAAAAKRSQSRARQVEDLIRQRTSELSSANDKLAREIDERTKTAAELLKSQEQYELLSENVSDVIWTLDTNMALNYISPSVKQLRGLTQEEALTQTVDQILTPESYAKILPVIAEALQRVEAGEVDPPPAYTLEMDMVTIDGSAVRTETTASVLLNPEKEVVGFLGVTRDIEARKRSEEEKTLLETQLRQSQKMEAIGTLAGGIAHDFNNLLTGILGYANLLKLQTNEESSTYEAADVIEKAAQRASELTKQLLGFARQGKLQNSAVNLHSMISESVALLRRTIDKSINIVQRMDAESSDVMGDPSQLQLVMLNLAVNARDAMPDGGDMTIETACVNMDAGAHADLGPGCYIRLRVSDTGAGIPPELCERIFEPFFTTKSPGEGTGLGLATVYGIVKNHDGTVTVDSELTRGTTFEVLLPIASETSEVDVIDEIETPVHGRGKILVVEDEEVVRKLATEILGWLGYETVTVCDGVEAVEYYDGHNDDIDLALIDLNMPRMGGRECYQRMKKINPDLRAVLSTGYSRDGAAQEILDDGVQGFVQKPFQASQLSEAIALAMK